MEFHCSKEHRLVRLQYSKTTFSLPFFFLGTMGSRRVTLLTIVGWFTVVCLVQLSADAILVGSVLLPHGDFAYDPFLLPPLTKERRAAEHVALSSRRAGRWLANTARPDIVFVSTPHGIKLDYDYGIYAGSPKGKGVATIGNDLQTNATAKKVYNVSMQVDLAPDLSEELMELLHDRNVEGIYSYDDGAPFPLNWGEIIPLLLLPQPQSFQYLIWSHPHRRYDHAALEMVPELLNLGATIAKWAHDRPERIAVLISGDLSHTHLQEPQGPYGYSNASAPFDAALGRWAKNPCEHASSLLHRARRLQGNAKSCGFTGYVLWHGMMCANSSSSFHQTYRSSVLDNRNVTYYGMMAAIFDPMVGLTRPTGKVEVS
jgi:aromatic ring-opening dioxygenase LigB subunit